MGELLDDLYYQRGYKSVICLTLNSFKELYMTGIQRIYILHEILRL